MTTTDVPAEREMRERLRHLTADPGPLGSAVCALLKAAEAEVPVMVMPDESRAILDLLAPQEAWRSVTDSLPKPGADVIAGYRDTAGWRCVRAVYAAARSVVCTCERDGDCFCEMDDTGESWWPEGWYEIADNADDVNTWRIRGTVTHWMPLPTAPGENELAAETGVREAPPISDTAVARIIEAVEAHCGMGHGAWDMVAARDLVEGFAAALGADKPGVLLTTAAGAPEEGAGE